MPPWPLFNTPNLVFLGGKTGTRRNRVVGDNLFRRTRYQKGSFPRGLGDQDEGIISGGDGEGRKNNIFFIWLYVGHCFRKQSVENLVDEIRHKGRVFYLRTRILYFFILFLGTRFVCAMDAKGEGTLGMSRKLKTVFSYKIT